MARPPYIKTLLDKYIMSLKLFSRIPPNLNIKKDSTRDSIRENKKRGREMDIDTDLDIDFEKKLRLGRDEPISQTYGRPTPLSPQSPPRNFIEEYYQRQKQIDKNFVDKDQQITEMQRRIQELEQEVVELKSKNSSNSSSCYCQQDHSDGYYWDSVLN